MAVAKPTASGPIDAASFDIAGLPPIEQIGFGPTLADTQLPLAHPAAPSGCFRADPSGLPAFIEAGTSGCTAADHVEVTHTNGDVANISWSGAGTGFAVTVSVVAGNWSGTTVQVTAGHVSGTVRYASTAAGTQIDADVDWRDSFNPGKLVGNIISGNSQHIDGETLDRATRIHLVSHFGGGGQATDSGGLAGSFSGSAQLDLLDASGAPQHSLVWNDVETSSLSQLSSLGFFTGTVVGAGGGVFYDGSQVGSISLGQSGLVTAWTDGTTDPFSASASIWPDLPPF